MTHRRVFRRHRRILDARVDTETSTRRPRLIKALSFTAGLLALWALLGFAVAPAVVRPILEKRLSESLHRKAAVRGLAINPFTLSATVRGLSVGERGAPGTFLAFETLHVNLEALSLVRGGPVIRELVLAAPTVSLVRNEDLTYNISDLLEELAKDEDPGKKPARFSVNNIRVTGGTIDFDDRPKGARHEVRELSLGIPFLSNIPSKVEIFTQPSLSARVSGAAMALRGKTKPFSETRETSVEIDLADVDLPHYLSYVPGKLPVRLSAGRLDTKLALSFSQPAGKPSALIASGTASLRDGALVREDRPLLSVRRLDAALASFDVFGGELKLSAVTAVSPEIWIRRGRDGLELSQAFAKPAAGAVGKAPASTPFRYEISEIRVQDGTLRYDDSSLGKPFATTLAPVAISLRGLSSSPGARPASLELDARSDAGETLKHAGTFTLEPLVLDGSVELAGLPLRRYAPWYEGSLLADVDDGTLSAAARYTFRGGNTTLTGLSARLEALKVRKRGESKPFLTIPSASLDGTDVDLGARTLALGTLSSQGGFLAVRREADGAIDLQRLMVASEEPVASESPRSPWRIQAKLLSLERYTLKVDDLAPGKPARLLIRPATIAVEGFSTAKGERGTLSTRFAFDGKGLMSAAGPIGLSPPYAELKVAVKDVDLVPLEPYILSQIRLSMTRGKLNGSGTLSFRPGPKDAVSVAFAGNAVAGNVAAVEEESKEEFLRWESLSLERVRAGYNPTFVEVARLAASGVACHIGIAEDGTVNLRSIVGGAAPSEGDGDLGDEDVEPGAASEPPPPPEPVPSPSPAPEPPMPMRFDAITLEGGTIALTDHLVKPSFSARLTDVGGRVTGLSSADNTKADVDLRGKLAGESPLEITGSVNPLAAASHADLKVSFRDIDLVPWTPYFGRYAGYAVAKGKLTMIVHYLVKERRLEAQNKLLVDQFTFGDKVESASATKLPVRLAVSLLKDRNGLIDLDLPISGSLDDPKFRIGKIVWKVLVNLIGKAVTSPFALLGKLFGGGGEELSTVEFEAGRDTLTAASRQRLDALSKALLDRPGLKLEAAGRFDQATDAEGLRRLRFERKVKAEKVDVLLGERAAPPSLDEVVVSAEEWPAFLKKAYKRERFPKPKTALGFAKDLPPDEMEKLMLANLEVTPEDLRQLALSRAQAVKDYLFTSGKVETERVFLVEPGPSGDGKKTGASVDFVLR